MKSPHLQQRGIIFREDDPNSTKRVACYPGLTRLSDGRILCAFRVGQSKSGPDESLRMAQSSDEGQTWQPLPFPVDATLNGTPGSMSIGTVLETSPGHILLLCTWIDRTDPALPISHPETAGCLELRLVKSHSHDGGGTWSAIEEVQNLPFPQPEVSGPVIALAQPGHLLLPMENQKGFYDPNPIDEKCYALLSYDGGQTWPQWAMVAHDFPNRKFWCNRIARFPSGKLACVSWTFDEKTQADLPLHITYGSPDGKEWGTPMSTGVYGQVSYLFPLDETTVLMGTSHRESPAGIRLRTSHDGGATWNGDGVLVFDAENQASQSGGELPDYYHLMTNYTFGWSPMVRLNDGSVLMAHFAGASDDIAIHWIKIGF
jgi:hypothetical protein